MDSQLVELEKSFFRNPKIKVEQQLRDIGFNPSTPLAQKRPAKLQKVTPVAQTRPMEIAPQAKPLFIDKLPKDVTKSVAKGGGFQTSPVQKPNLMDRPLSDAEKSKKDNTKTIIIVVGVLVVITISFVVFRKIKKRRNGK